MFSKNLSQRIQRHNTIPIKILFRIEIKKITFLSLNFLNENEINEISLCFERGGKIATTTEKQIYYKENEVLFNEILSLVVTMYKNNNNNEYQDKEGKLIIRQKRKTLKKGDVYRTIGTCVINLASTFQSNNSVELSLPLTHCSIPGGSAIIHVHIMSKEIGECNDDTKSQDSGYSDAISDFSADYETNFENNRLRSSLTLPSQSQSQPPPPPASPYSSHEFTTRNSTSSISHNNNYNYNYSNTSTNLLKVLSSHPELLQQWNDLEKNFRELNQRYELIIQQRDMLTKDLRTEREKKKFFEDEFNNLKKKVAEDNDKQKLESYELTLKILNEKCAILTKERDELKSQINTNIGSNINNNNNVNNNGNNGNVKRVSINESIEPPLESPNREHFKRSNSNPCNYSTDSTDLNNPVTPLRSILTTNRRLSQSFRTPIDDNNTKTTNLNNNNANNNANNANKNNNITPETRSLRSLSATRSVSFRGLKSSSSDLVQESPDSPYNRPRPKTQPASELTSSLTTFQEKITPTRRASVSFGKPATKIVIDSPLNFNNNNNPSAVKFLEEISSLRKEIKELRQLGTEMEGLYKEGQIEIQYLLEGKRRLENENKQLKEKYDKLEKMKEKLEEKIKNFKKDEDSEIRDEILWTKIQVEKENAELKLEYEKLERNYHKLQKKLETNSLNGTNIETKQIDNLSFHNSIEKIDQETKINLLEQQIMNLNDIIRSRDLQIKKLCLYNQINNNIIRIENISQNIYDEQDQHENSYENEIEKVNNNNNNDNKLLQDELTIQQQIDENNRDISLLSYSLQQQEQQGKQEQSSVPSSIISNITSTSNIVIENPNQIGELISELIQCKLHLAINLTKIDNEKLRYKVLKYNQRKYLTKITELEVENVLLLTKFNNLAEENNLNNRSWYPKWLKKYIK